MKNKFLSFFSVFLSIIFCMSSCNKTEVINGIKIKWDKNISPSQKKVIEELLNNMVYVEGDTIIYNDSNGKEKKEIRIKSFYICKYETDQNLWETMMLYNPSEIKGEIYQLLILKDLNSKIY